MTTVANKLFIKVDKVLTTDGLGYWSDKCKNVRITALELCHDEDLSYGELIVHFDTKTWNINKDGLIYSDKLFMHELKHFLVSLGLTSYDIGYSEQGMQGNSFVSLDVGPQFIKVWINTLV